MQIKRSIFSRLRWLYNSLSPFSQHLVEFDIGDGNWRQAKAWSLLLSVAVEVNALAQGALRRFTQWWWIEHPTFQLRGGHFTTELMVLWHSYSGFSNKKKLWFVFLNPWLYEMTKCWNIILSYHASKVKKISASKFQQNVWLFQKQKIAIDWHVNYHLKRLCVC